MRVAVEDWLEPRLAANGYPVIRHRTRRAPTAAWARTGGTYTPVSGTDPLALATALAAPGTDALFVGLDQPFRGLYVGLVDSVNSNACAASLTYWNGTWHTFGSSIVNTTFAATVPFGRGGRIGWPVPTDWTHRTVNDARAYWLRLQVNSPVSASTIIDQLLPITRSRLTHAVAHQALGLLYTEGFASSRGEWKEKAKDAFMAAQAHLDLVINQVADEFDPDDDGVAEPTEVNSLTREPWTWERG
jgi:hypothetical protein